MSTGFTTTTESKEAIRQSGEDYQDIDEETTHEYTDVREELMKRENIGPEILQGMKKKKQPRACLG